MPGECCRSTCCSLQQLHHLFEAVCVHFFVGDCCSLFGILFYLVLFVLDLGDVELSWKILISMAEFQCQDHYHLRPPDPRRFMKQIWLTHHSWIIATGRHPQSQDITNETICFKDFNGFVPGSLNLTLIDQRKRCSNCDWVLIFEVPRLAPRPNVQMHCCSFLKVLDAFTCQNFLRPYSLLFPDSVQIGWLRLTLADAPFEPGILTVQWKGQNI